MKYVVVIGSVMSGIGKGITASSIGVVLKNHGLRVTAIKIDPYLNLDSGTMSPFEHGECYVLNDGGETDLDLGNYERFCDLALTRDHNITTGKIYRRVIEAERRGDYLGKTVQVVPHVVNQIQDWIERTARICTDGSDYEPEVCIIELGGTIGDMESDAYVEALRQMSFRIGRENVFFVNVCYCPVISVTDEVKTKPAQNGIREVRRHGINPDLLMVRCQRELNDEAVEKLSNICQIPRERILINQNVSNIYRIPLAFEEKGLFQTLAGHLNLRESATGLIRVGKRGYVRWQELAEKMDSSSLRPVEVGVIGKYTGMIDSYLSLSHAINDAGLTNGLKTKLNFVEASSLEDLDENELKEKLEIFEFLLIPGGFGQRGIEGMIRAAEYARVHAVPCLGICLGFQVMVIEFARNVMDLVGANSREFDSECTDPVIKIIKEDQDLGGTMRLGLQMTRLAEGSRAWRAYGGESKTIRERHRHRYEVNPEYLEAFDTTQMFFSGVSEDGLRMEILELQTGSDQGGQFYMGTQFHGEYLTRPGQAHPIFVEWLKN